MRKPRTIKMWTEKEVKECIEKQYIDFCKYRYDVPNQMPDRGIGLYSKRSFNGTHFDVQ